MKGVPDIAETPFFISEVIIMEQMVSRIDHVSIAVKDFEKAEKFFRTLLGGIPGASAEDKKTKYFWQIYSLGDLTRLELITSTGAGSFLDNFLAEREGGVHHITLQTPDIAETRKILEQQGIPYFGYHEYKGAYWKELFIHPRHAFGVLIQISEFHPDDWLAKTVKLEEGNRWIIKKDQVGVGLHFSHPGGGKVQINLTKDDVKKMIADLETALTSC
ncbi:MAG: methylmalonyl-CoA/ethylmalonyl-CoA epimerase [Syntrophus sp. SKADARSKE-3]|nr:methylmalonyl-CoA/ethylmalonyl-CoA epimerase [Syntrophus sp. SKADARSKE-3]